MLLLLFGSDQIGTDAVPLLQNIQHSKQIVTSLDMVYMYNTTQFLHEAHS